MGCLLIYGVSASYHEKQPAIYCRNIEWNSKKLCFTAWILCKFQIQTYSTIELERTHKTHHFFLCTQNPIPSFVLSHENSVSIGISESLTFSSASSEHRCIEYALLLPVL